ncbi:MAG: hypothetical protein HC858_09205 [Brachymonas sp.]|nr:hypothetical protein [Brachymonas sp.]
MASTPPRPLGVIDEPFGARVTLRQCLDVVMDQAPAIIDKVIESIGGKDDKPVKGIGWCVRIFRHRCKPWWHF